MTYPSPVAWPVQSLEMSETGDRDETGNTPPPGSEPRVVRFGPDIDWERSVYVGRAMARVPSTVPGCSGFFASPLRLRAGGELERCTLVVAYAQWLAGPAGIMVRNQLARLAGKDLVCWCAPQRCHAEVLLAWANHGPDAVDGLITELRARRAALTPPRLFD